MAPPASTFASCEPLLRAAAAMCATSSVISAAGATLLPGSGSTTAVSKIRSARNSGTRCSTSSSGPGLGAAPSATTVAVSCAGSNAGPLLQQHGKEWRGVKGIVRPMGPSWATAAKPYFPALLLRRQHSSSFGPPLTGQGQRHSYPLPPGPGPDPRGPQHPRLPHSHSHPGLPQPPISHGPGPGLPLEAAGSAPPLQRPDRLSPDVLTGPINIAQEHEGDPRDTLYRLIRSATSTSRSTTPPWCSLDDEEQDSANTPEDLAESGCAVTSPQLQHMSANELAAMSAAVLPRLPPAQVAAMAVALARLGQLQGDGGGFKEALVEHVVGRMYQFTPHQLADVAWSMASSGAYDLSLLESLAGRLRATAAQWDAHSLSKVLWAFGRFRFPMGQEPSVGAEAVADMVEALQGDLDGSSVAEVVFAAGQLCNGHGDWQAGRLQRLVADFARDNITAFGPEALGKLAAGLQGLGLAGEHEQLLCDTVSRRAAELAPRLEPEDVCRVMELLSAHPYRYDPARLDTLADRAAELASPPAPRLAPHQAGDLAAGFRALDFVSGSVLRLAGRAHAGVGAGAGEHVR